MRRREGEERGERRREGEGERSVVSCIPSQLREQITELKDSTARERERAGDKRQMTHAWREAERDLASEREAHAKGNRNRSSVDEREISTREIRALFSPWLPSFCCSTLAMKPLVSTRLSECHKSSPRCFLR